MSDRSFSDEELRNEVIHRSNLGESERRIAQQLGVSRWKVTKIIRQNRKSRSVQEPNLESSSQSPNHTDTIPASLGRPVQKRDTKHGHKAWGHTQTTILDSYLQSRPEMKLTANKNLRRRTPPLTESRRISACSAQANLKR